MKYKLIFPSFEDHFFDKKTRNRQSMVYCFTFSLKKSIIVFFAIFLGFNISVEKLTLEINLSAEKNQ